jgi:hypothetical protein
VLIERVVVSTDESGRIHTRRFGATDKSVRLYGRLSRGERVT